MNSHNHHHSQNSSHQGHQHSSGQGYSQPGGQHPNGASQWTHQPYNQGQYPYYSYQTNGSQYSMKRENHQKKNEGKKNGALKVAALLLACALLGFGGGMAALLIKPNNSAGQTVVYKATSTPVSTQGIADAEDHSVVDIAAKAGASVVSIDIKGVDTDYFMGSQPIEGAGSGVIISQDGTIITNNHVVEGARNITVTLPDGSKHQATLVGRDPATDVAVLKIDATDLTPAVIGDSDTLKVGEFCLAIGNPMGTLSGTVTDGIISAMNREITIDTYSMNLIQMSAAVSPGNSGGGLFNAKGELVGIVNAKSGGAEAEGLGFSIPVNNAMRIAEELISNGKITRAGLNIMAEDILTEVHAAQAGVDDLGVYIRSVNSMGAADKAGLKVGDRLLKVDGQEIKGIQDLSKILGTKKVGDTIEVVVVRNGSEITKQVTLEEVTPD